MRMQLFQNHENIGISEKWNPGTRDFYKQDPGTLKCLGVRLTKWHQYIFSISLKFVACYITGHWGEFRVKNDTICLHILFWYFFVIFHHKICVFMIFISFFDKVSNFCSRILTDQKRELMVSNCQRNCMRWDLEPPKWDPGYRTLKYSSQTRDSGPPKLN